VAACGGTASAGNWWLLATLASRCRPHTEQGRSLPSLLAAPITSAEDADCPHLHSLPHTHGDTGQPAVWPAMAARDGTVNLVRRAKRRPCRLFAS